MNYVNLIKELCLLGGVSGFEDNVRNFILSEISEYVDECKVDNLGNIIAFKKGKQRAKNKLMMCAHMDEIGLIVTHVTEDGYLGFSTVGGIDVKILHGIAVNVGNSKVKGVIGIKPIHLTQGKEKNTPLKVDNLFIDIGANNKEDALKNVNVGDFVTFNSVFEESSDSMISKALDDRAGCSILINIIKGSIEFDTYFVFTVQEEIGLIGAKVASYGVNPDCAVVVETTTACDLPSVEESKKVCKLGEGAVISFMDKGTIYDKSLYNLCLSTAKENNIPVQTKKAVAGGNDSGAIHCSREGVKTIAISIPCRYLHSPEGIIFKSDYSAVNDLAKTMISKINEM